MDKKPALLGVLVAILVSGALRGGLFGKEDVKSARFLDKVAAEMNKQLPRTLDDETEWVNTDAEQGVLIYNYRLSQRLAGEIDAPLVMSRVKPQAVQGVCQNTDLKDKFLRRGVALRYTYVDRAGTLVGSFEIRPADCGV